MARKKIFKAAPRTQPLQRKSNVTDASESQPPSTTHWGYHRTSDHPESLDFNKRAQPSAVDDLMAIAFPRPVNLAQSTEFSYQNAPPTLFQHNMCLSQPRNYGLHAGEGYGRTSYVPMQHNNMASLQPASDVLQNYTYVGSWESSSIRGASESRPLKRQRNFSEAPQNLNGLHTQRNVQLPPHVKPKAQPSMPENKETQPGNIEIESLDDLKKHKEKYQRKDLELFLVGRKTLYKCNMCQRPSERAQHIISHMKRTHFKNFVFFRCYICGLNVEYITQLRRHFRRSHKINVHCDLQNHLAISFYPHEVNLIHCASLDCRYRTTSRALLKKHTCYDVPLPKEEKFNSATDVPGQLKDHRLQKNPQSSGSCSHTPEGNTKSNPGGGTEQSPSTSVQGLNVHSGDGESSPLKGNTGQESTNGTPPEVAESSKKNEIENPTSDLVQVRSYVVLQRLMEKYQSHNPELSSIKGLKVKSCPICNFKIRKERTVNLISHMKAKHNRNFFLYRCYICGLDMDCCLMMLKHILVKHNQDLQPELIHHLAMSSYPNPVRFLQCNKCNYRSASEILLQNHLCETDPGIPLPKHSSFAAEDASLLDECIRKSDVPRLTGVSLTSGHATSTLKAMVLARIFRRATPNLTLELELSSHPARLYRA